MVRNKVQGQIESGHLDEVLAELNKSKDENG